MKYQTTDKRTELERAVDEVLIVLDQETSETTAASIGDIEAREFLKHIQERLEQARNRVATAA